MKSSAKGRILKLRDALRKTPARSIVRRNRSSIPRGILVELTRRPDTARFLINRRTTEVNSLFKTERGV